jgi:hypothetical protein
MGPIWRASSQVKILIHYNRIHNGIALVANLYDIIVFTNLGGGLAAFDSWIIDGMQ